jgi:hypothetical protein
MLIYLEDVGFSPKVPGCRQITCGECANLLYKELWGVVKIMVSGNQSGVVNKVDVSA